MIFLFIFIQIVYRYFYIFAKKLKFEESSKCKIDIVNVVLKWFCAGIMFHNILKYISHDIKIIGYLDFICLNYRAVKG